MNNEHNILDQAAKAHSESTIPKGPSDDLIRQTLEKIEKEQTTIPFMERIYKMKSISKFAAAAIIIVGVSVLFLFNSSPVALADVYAKVQQAQAFMYKMSMTMTGSMMEGEPERLSESEATIVNSNQYGSTVDTYSVTQDKTTHQKMYIIPDKKMMVTVLPDEKKFLRMEFSQELLEHTEMKNNDPRRMIKQMLGCEYTDLGFSEINGIKVQGFQTTDPTYINITYDDECKVVLWVDVHTWLPVYSEMDFVVGDNMKMHTEIHGFQWNIPVRAVDFEPNIPDDYEELGSVRMPETNEESALEGLRKHTELTGHYPKSLDSMKLMTETMKALESLPEIQELKKNKKENAKELVDRLMQEMLPIQSIGMFYATLMQEKKDPAYYGDRVTPDDVDAVLMRWKVEGDTYKVIFGDLTITEMEYDKLKEIEPQPESAQPEPAQP
jgi:archaellum component FlaF (FlaF/FlaG flagellin family)